MKHSRWLVTALVLCVLAPAVPAQEKSPLAMVPAQAPIVFHLRGVERTKGRLVTMINNALPDLGKKMQESLEDSIKSELGERQLKGLAPFGPAFLVLTEMPRADQEAPAMAFVLRVTDAKAFRAGFFTEQERKTLRKDPAGFEALKYKEDEAYLLERDGYLVIARQKESITPFLKPGKGLDSKLGADAAKRMLETDAGVYIDLGEVYRLYGQTVRDARQFIDLALQQPGVDKDTMEMMKSIIDGALQVFEDSRGLLLTADFRPDGVALHGQIKFGAESKSNQFLKLLNPSDLKAVDTLPAGQMAYTAVHTEPALNRVFSQFLLGIMASPESKQGKQLQQALELMNEAGPQGTLATANLQSHGVGLSRYKDPAKAVQAQLQIFKSMTEGGTYNQMQLKKATIQTDAQKHRGITFHHVDLQWDFEKMADAQPGGKEMVDAMRKMIGDGQKIWFGTDGKVVLSAMGKDWADAQKRLDNFLDAKDPIGKVAAFQETRKQLPSQSNLLALYDVPQLMDNVRVMFATMFRALGQGELKLEPAKEKAKPTFLGFALTLKAEHAAFDMWIPGVTAREVQKMIEPLLGAFGG